ncbi:MAG: LPS export ABC transporter permease LptG [Pseudomonadota bacterium]|nr:LPS export ABC transporter permease LptG [Pseudomonadota bacterium]
MLANRILANHVARVTGLAMLGASGLLLLLQILFTYLGQLGDLKEGYNAWAALRYVLWESPRYLYELLPIAALIGSVVGLGTLASNSELVVMRAAGQSLWRIVGWVLRPAVALMIASLMISEWVLPYSSEQAQSIRHQAGRAATLGEVRGYWTREQDRFIYIEYANSAGELRQIEMLKFDSSQRLLASLAAKQGQYQAADRIWQLDQVQQTQIQPDGSAQAEQMATLPMSLGLQPRFVHLVTMSPDMLAPSQLWGYIRYLSTQGQVPASYRLALWQKMTAPFALAALVVLACSFIFGPLRQQSVGFRLVIALFVGLGFRYLQDFLGYASLIYPVSAGWFVGLPIILLFGIGGLALRRMR